VPYLFGNLVYHKYMKNTSTCKRRCLQQGTCYTAHRTFISW